MTSGAPAAFVLAGSPAAEVFNDLCSKSEPLRPGEVVFVTEDQLASLRKDVFFLPMKDDDGPT